MSPATAVGQEQRAERVPLPRHRVGRGRAATRLEDGREDQGADDVGHQDGEDHHHPGRDQLALVAFDLVPAEGDGVPG